MAQTRTYPVLFGLIFFLLILQDPLLAAILELRQEGTSATESAILVGDEIEIELWLDSENEELSGAAIFLSFDDEVFSLVDEDRSPVQGFQPFARGEFLRSGEEFRNVALDPSDPAASQAGEQLDFSIIRAEGDQGRGAAAVFRLRAIAPAARSLIRIDESGIRETRFFTPDGDNRPFRFITPLSVTVRGIGISGLPSELVLARGQVDSTTFHLNDVIFDPLYSPVDIDWTVSRSATLALNMNSQTNRLVIAAPELTSSWERLTLTATNPDGQTASFVVDVYVNAGPELPEQLDEVVIQEDGSYDVRLDDMVIDPDTPADKLSWTGSVEGALTLRIEGPPYVAHVEPAANWSGTGSVTLVVTDEFGFLDSAVLQITVAAVNDAPEFSGAPNLQIVRGRLDSSLVLRDLILDEEDDTEALVLSWSGDENVSLQQRSGRLVVSTLMDWQGTETIQLQVEDSQGLVATAPLTVTVVSSLAPALTNPPEQLGLSAGEVTILELESLAIDPDDQSGDLQWRVSGQVQLQVQLSTSGAARIEAPDGFTGTETLLFSVIDPTGESASFELFVFESAPNGEPFLSPIPSLEVPRGGVNASIDLDDFVFDRDSEPAEMVWFAPTVDGVDVRIDPVTHVLSIAVSDSAAISSLALELRVLDPDGHEVAQIWTLRILGADGEEPMLPEVTPDPVLLLSPLPSLTIRAGEFDQSIVLDDYIDGVDPASMTWEIGGNVHTQVILDSGSRKLTILADGDWSGQEILIVVGTDLLGNIVEGLIGIQILPVEVELIFRELTEISAFAGDTSIQLEATTLISGGDIGSLDSFQWEASGSQSISVEYEPENDMLTLTTDSFPEGNEIITLVARDGQREFSGRLLISAHPTDGSYGEESDRFRLVVVPNAVQPDYLDLFVISDVQATRPPRLRAHDATWLELPVTGSAPGIWQGDYVLRPGMEGELRLLALTLDSQSAAHKATSSISIGTAVPTSAKMVSAAGANVRFEPRAFSREAVVALIPGEIEAPGPELISRSRSIFIHSPQTLEGSARITFGLPSSSELGRAGLYRWNGAESRWSFLHSDVSADDISAPIDRLGRYALLLDPDPPRFEGLETPDGELHFLWRDEGSGLGQAEVSVDGVRLPDSGYFWKADLLVVRTATWLPGKRLVQAHVADRAGNVTVVERLVSVAGVVTPEAFTLQQNYPNPFNPSTLIPFSVPADVLTPIRLSIFNTAGQQIRLLVSPPLPAGLHELTWDGLDASGRQVSSGMYLYQIEAAGMTRVRRMTLQR